MKFKEIKGNPFEAVNEKITRITKNGYIIYYKIDVDINRNVYEIISKFKRLTELELQLYISKEYKLLTIKINSKSKKDLKNSIEEIEKIINDIEVKTERINTEKYAEYMNIKINNDSKNLEEFNKETDKAKYTKEHIEINDKYITLENIREYPRKINLKNINELADISINFKFKNDNKGQKIYQKIKNNLGKKKKEADKRVEMTSYNPVYPYKLKEQLKQIEGISENCNVVGLEINLLIEADSENELNKKIKEIEKRCSRKLLIDQLINNIKKETFINSLTFADNKKNLTPGFLRNKDKDIEIVFFKNIKTEKNKENILSKKIKTEKIKELIGIEIQVAKKGIIEELYENGIFQTADLSYSAIYEFENVNYSLEGEENKISILESYQKFINTINENINVQLYIANYNQDIDKAKNNVFININNKYQKEIEEYNEYLKNKTIESYNNSADTKNYMVISIKAKNIEEAEEENKRIINDIKQEFNTFGSKITKLNPEEVIQLLYNSMNGLNYNNYYLNNDYDYQSTIDEKIKPETMRIATDHIHANKTYKKMFYVKKYPNDMTDKFINNLTKLPFNLEISIHIKALNAEQGIKKINNKVVSMEGARKDKQKKDQGTGYVPFKLENDLIEGYYILDKLNNEDQKLFLTTFIVTIFSENKNQLKTREKILKNTFAKSMFDFNNLYLRQEKGLITSLPVGMNTVSVERALLTENITYLHPFSYCKLCHGKGGFFYGLNEDSSMIVVDRKNYDNTSGFTIGIPGSGKSFITKLEIINTFFNTEDDIIIIDPEREFGPLTEALDGEVIKLSTNTNNYINVMRLPKNTDESYSDEVRKKIEFIITFIEKLTEDQLTSSEKSILDRCLRKIYQDFKYKNDDPVLSDLYKALKNQTEELAEQIALKMEIYIEGSLDIFAKKSNVNINKRLVCFDIKDLREQLRPSAITVILDSTWERLNHNRDLGKFTRLYIDEFHLLAKNKSSSEWLVEAWKRVRKYRGIPTGITQNIPDIIINKNIASMLSNSEITVIMNQKAKDKDELINVMGLSENQVDKVINCQAGTGLLVAGKTVVGFNNRVSPEEIPNLYKLITTSHKD